MDDYFDDNEGNWGWSDPRSQNSFNAAAGPSQFSYEHNTENEDSDYDDNWHIPFQFESKANSSVITDDKNRRIISRESLFQDPESFQFTTNIVRNKPQNTVHEEQEVPVQQPDPDYNAGFDWTQKNWQKASNTGDATLTSKKIYQQYPRILRPTKLQKTLKAALAKPVKISKAESMMQKMGWQGGALGKSGDGILEPIAPNAIYSSRSGFGQRVEPVKKQKKPQKQHKPPKQIVMKLKSKAQKEIYHTNALNHILDFVRNDFEVEIKFDSKLRPIERKHIHHIVNEVINCSGENVIDMNFDNLVQMDILQEIKSCNIFVLGTQSEGQPPNRCLCVYKEPSDHMYLITPSDLREEEDKNEESYENIDLTEEADANETENSKFQGKDNDMEVETKSVSLNNLQNNIENDKKSTEDVTEKFKKHCSIGKNPIDPEILKKLVEYFIEFLETEDYMEFRFIGTYNSEEIETINYFLRNYLTLIKLLQDKEKVMEDLEKSGYYVQCMEDDNGSILFLKMAHDNTNK